MPCAKSHKASTPSHPRGLCYAALHVCTLRMLSAMAERESALRVKLPPADSSPLPQLWYKEEENPGGEIPRWVPQSFSRHLLVTCMFHDWSNTTYLWLPSSRAGDGLDA